MTNDARSCPRCRSPLPSDAPAGSCPRCLLAAGFESADGAPADDVPERAEIERRFPDMELTDVLGRGGMGIVFKARQKSLDRVVALKVLPQAVAAGGGDAGRFEERFTREARALARLSHPHIVGVHEFGERDGLYYFVMEYVDGVNLRQAMAGEGLSPQQALAIVPQICDALQYAHDQGVVHRDIKPENVLLDREGCVKIADFGLAKLVVRTAGDRTLTRQGLVMGTPHYMAPEQLETPADVDHRADIYSLGVVLYEMLTGELPLGRFAKPSEKVAVDVRLDEVVLRSLEKERERRYQRAAEVRTSIDGVAAGAPAAPRRADGPRTSRLAVWGLLATPLTIALSIGVLVVAYALLDSDGTDSGSTVGMGIAMVLTAVVGLGFLAGVVLSAAALISISRSGGRKQGMGLAIAGLLLPLLCVVPGAGWMLVLQPAPVPQAAPGIPVRTIDEAPLPESRVDDGAPDDR